MGLFQRAAPGGRFEAREVVGGQHGRGVPADGEEGAVAERDLSRIAHDETEPDDDDRVVDGHRELRQAVFLVHCAEDKLRRDQRDDERDDSDGRPEFHVRIP